MQLQTRQVFVLFCALQVAKCRLNKQYRGVNKSGTEYSCVNGYGVFDGPADENSVRVLKTWNINAVRLPLNEDCWLGANGHDTRYSGTNYRAAITRYISILKKYGITVILALQWSGGLFRPRCDFATSKCQKPMPNLQNSPRFWRSVASYYVNDPLVFFELFSEPYHDAFMAKNQAWLCLKNGGKYCGSRISYQVAGMQTLVDTIRKTGARNPILVPGLSFSNDMSQWVKFAPADSANNLVASWHSYLNNLCNKKSCWDTQIAPIQNTHDVFVGEMGEYDCGHSYVDTLMAYLDRRKISYLAWAWNLFDCAKGPALIRDFNGDPTNYGQGVKDHFLKFPRQ